MERQILSLQRFTAPMRSALKQVAATCYAPHATDRTIRALERLGVVEHTSIGWRLTSSGIRWVRHLP